MELSISGLTEISKSKYNEIMKRAKALVSVNNSICEIGYETKILVNVKECEKYTQTTTYFNNGVCDFILEKVVCKDGYKFK